MNTINKEVLDEKFIQFIMENDLMEMPANVSAKAYFPVIKKEGYTKVEFRKGSVVKITEQYLSKSFYRMRAESGSSKNDFDGDYEKRKDKSDLSLVKKKYDALLDEYEKLKRILGVKDEVFRPMQDFHIPVKGSQVDQSVAVALASDWHYEEEVTLESTNFMNKFNLDVADNRIKNFFGNTVKMLAKEQKDSQIKTMILALLGDFITGNIHEDNVESSQLGVGDALWQVKSRIHSGIEFILANSDVDLIIPCHSGNHGRHTKKQFIANERNNSLEWLMYKSIAEIWSGHKRVKFLVGDAYHSFVEVFPGYTIRFHHGHNVRYGGGVGGITIPINKAVAQWNRSRSAQLDCMGHFHQYCDGGNFVVNSSLIGYSPYGISVKGAYERPSQSFFLINGKYLEKTCSSKIFLDEE